LKMQPSRGRDLSLLVVWIAAFGAIFYLFEFGGHNIKGRNAAWFPLVFAYAMTSYWFGYVTCARIRLRPRSFFIAIGDDLGVFIMIIYICLWGACAVIWGWVGLVSTPVEIALCIRRIVSSGRPAVPPVHTGPYFQPNDFQPNAPGYYQPAGPQYPQPSEPDPAARPARPAGHRRKLSFCVLRR
jgi:hypothetical protein